MGRASVEMGERAWVWIVRMKAWRVVNVVIAGGRQADLRTSEKE